MNSPFFQPSDSKRKRISSTAELAIPGGGRIQYLGGSKQQQPNNEVVVRDEEHKSTIFGATCNLINGIIGAAIVGIPFAIKQTGLGAGFLMIIGCAFLHEKSLRLLVETAKHVGVSTYELLLESCFGQVGFIFISVNMLIMSYGALVGYLLVIKDTLPILMGIDPSNAPMRRAVVAVASLLICLPLSSQRDVADLAKTSMINVLFDCILVSIVVCFSPISESVAANGGSSHVFALSGFLKPSTFFIGLGILSFAFVCQHASFVIAGSLKNPTKERWKKVTQLGLATCGLLMIFCGMAGYLGFQAATEGNILNSFLSYPNDETKFAANIARGLLCSAIFFVYPIESFVARHVCVVLLFKGRQAHGGDDHAVLSRRDRRLSLTFAIYVCALAPALFVDDLGSVWAITGVVAGSCLSYIGPGAAYLAVHGSDFLHLVRSSSLWGKKGTCRSLVTNTSTAAAQILENQEHLQLILAGNDNNVYSVNLLDPSFVTSSRVTQSSLLCPMETILWYMLLMPFWVQIARCGEKQLMIFKGNEALKTPLPTRLGKVVGSLIGAGELDITPQRRDAARRKRLTAHEESKGYHSTCDALHLELPNNFTKTGFLPFDSPHNRKMNYSHMDGSLDHDGQGSLHLALVGETHTKKSYLSLFCSRQIDVEQDNEEIEIDPQIDLPCVEDFLIAIGYIVFGLVALSVGLLSIICDSPENG